MITFRFCTLILLLMSALYATEQAPSWVQGIRNGTEGIKLVSGKKIFYRRLVSDTEDDKNLTCQKAIEAAEDSLKSEILSDVKIPYTLEVIFYDPKIKDCSVTISISNDLMNKLLELNKFKNEEKKLRLEVEADLKMSKNEKADIEKKYAELKVLVNKNSDLFNKYNNMMSDYDRAVSITKNRANKAQQLAVSGLRLKEFQSMMKEHVEINIAPEALCYTKLRNMLSSNHAGVNVCWTTVDNSSEIVAYCFEDNCYK